MNSFETRLATGAVAGFAGGAAVSAILAAAVALRIDPASDLVQMQRRGLRMAGRSALPPKHPTTLAEEAAGHAWHLVLSAALGAVYAASGPSPERMSTASGAAWGLGFYPVAFWLLGPATGLTEPPWRERPDLLLRRPLVHLAFGMATAWAARSIGTRSGR